MINLREPLTEEQVRRKKRDELFGFSIFFALGLVATVVLVRHTYILGLAQPVEFASCIAAVCFIGPGTFLLGDFAFLNGRITDKFARFLNTLREPAA